MRTSWLALALLACGTEEQPTTTVEPSPTGMTSSTGDTGAAPTSSGPTAVTGVTGATGSTGDTAQLPTEIVVGPAVMATDPGGQPEHHPALEWGPTGWVAGWATFDGSNDGLVSTSRHYDSAFAAAGAPLSIVTGTTKPDIAAIDGGWLIAWQHVNSHQIGFRRVDDAGAVLDEPPIRIDDPGEVHAGTVDLAVRPDGSIVLLWYRGDTQGSVADPDDGVYRVAAIDAQGASVQAPSSLWSTPPGGGSPPDIVPMSDGRVAAAIQRRHGAPDANGYYAEKVELHFLDPQLRPNGDPVEVFDGGFQGASRPSLAVDADDRLAVGWRTYDGPRSHVFVASYDDQGLPLTAPLELAPAPAETDRPTLRRHPEGWLIAYEHSDDVDSITGVQLGLLDEGMGQWIVEPIDVCEEGVRCSRPALAGPPDDIALIHEQGPDGDTHIEIRTVSVR